MKNVITADLIRILRKPTYRILLLVVGVISVILAIQAKTNVWNGYTFAARQYDGLSTGLGMLLGLAVFLSVYADEFSSNTMQCLIGHGISRGKLLLVKFIDCVAVGFLSYALYTLLISLLALILGANMSGAEAAFLYSALFTWAVETIGFATISMILLYWLKNVVLATIVDLSLLLFVGTALTQLFHRVPALKFLHPEYALFDKQVASARASMLLGNGGGFFLVLWNLILACFVSILVSYLLFRKKELDF